MVPTLLMDKKAKNDRSIKKMYWNWIQYMTTTCTTTSFNNVMIAYIAERERSNRRWIYILKKMYSRYYADVFFREIFHRRFR